ncbi:MAG: hypothetical protein U9Q38_08070 [Thermodesulfobacteriota bacterium]|nr:hypothetical protein [Thermodesulfobacteriota bacterium]
MLKTQSDISRELGVSRQAIAKLKKLDPRPEYFVTVDGKDFIDDTHVEWIAYVTRKKLESPVEKMKSKKKSEGQKKKKEKERLIKSITGKVDKQIEKEIKKVKKGIDKQIESDKKKLENLKSPELTDEENYVVELQKRSAIATLEKEIFEKDIKREKAIQEEIKTMETKKDLAPIEIVKYFFSFSERIIGRLYRRPHEISPQLSDLYLAGEDKKAVNFIVKNMEEIVKGTVADLLKELKDDGYKIKGIKK